MNLKHMMGPFPEVCNSSLYLPAWSLISSPLFRQFDHQLLSKQWTRRPERQQMYVDLLQSCGPQSILWMYLLTVNTKAEVRLHVDSADWLPERVRTRMKHLVSTRHTLSRTRTWLYQQLLLTTHWHIQHNIIGYIPLSCVHPVQEPHQQTWTADGGVTASPYSIPKPEWCH